MSYLKRCEVWDKLIEFVETIYDILPFNSKAYFLHSIEVIVRQRRIPLRHG